MIEIKLDDSRILAALRELNAKMADMTPVMDEVGQYLVESVHQRFETSTAPDGSAWAERKPSTIAAMLDQRKGSRKKDGSVSAAGERFLAGSKILKRSGALESSIAHEPASTSVTVKAGGLPYAAAHQFGGKPYMIYPTKKKALAFGGIVRKSAKHPGQTARPYLGFSDENQSVILDILKGYLTP